MDTSEILTVTTSIVKLVGFSSDIIKGLYQLCERYQDAQLVLHGMVVQVQALRTALNRIDELAKSRATERHHQLVMDLDASLSFCDILLARLEKDVNGLISNGTMPQPAFTTRLRTAFVGGPASGVQAMLDRQACALNLLLTAYSWYVFNYSAVAGWPLYSLFEFHFFSHSAGERELTNVLRLASRWLSKATCCRALKPVSFSSALGTIRCPWSYITTPAQFCRGLRIDCQNFRESLPLTWTCWPLECTLNPRECWSNF